MKWDSSVALCHSENKDIEDCELLRYYGNGAISQLDREINFSGGSGEHRLQNLALDL